MLDSVEHGLKLAVVTNLFFPGYINDSVGCVRMTHQQRFHPIWGAANVERGISQAAGRKLRRIHEVASDEARHKRLQNLVRRRVKARERERALARKQAINGEKGVQQSTAVSSNVNEDDELGGVEAGYELLRDLAEQDKQLDRKKRREGANAIERRGNSGDDLDQEERADAARQGAEEVAKAILNPDIKARTFHGQFPNNNQNALAEAQSLAPHPRHHTHAGSPLFRKLREEPLFQFFQHSFGGEESPSAKQLQADTRGLLASRAPPEQHNSRNICSWRSRKR